MASEFNRYTSKPIEISTPELRALQISGVFATDNNAAFIAFLRSLDGVRVEVTDERIVAFITFDLDDLDAAFAELEARYLAGEGAAHARIWSVITQTYVKFNRHDLTGEDWAIIDHRRGALFASSDMFEIASSKIALQNGPSKSQLWSVPVCSSPYAHALPFLCSSPPCP